MPKTEVIIESQIDTVWDYVIDRENWHKWWGAALKAVSPGWQSGAKLVWENGDKTTLVLVEPKKKFQLSSMIMCTTYRFINKGNQQTLIECEFNPLGGAHFSDGGLAHKKSVDSKLEKLKECIESENVDKKRKNSWLQFKKSLIPGKNTFEFPDKCVYCGKQTYKSMKIEEIENELIKSEGMPATKKTYLNYTLELQVPYCKPHFFIAHFLRFYNWIIFSVGMAAVGYPYYILTKDYEPSGFTAGFERVILLVGGLFLCAIGGGLLFLLSNFGLSKIFPILKAVKLFKILALSIDVVNTRRLILEFYNEEIGHEFAMLNK